MADEYPSKMTRDEILAMPAGLEMDAAIREAFPDLPCCRCWFSLNSGPKGECETCGLVREFYSERIAAAWQVMKRVQKELFSVRRCFMLALQEQTYHEIQGTGEKTYIAWPDVLWFVEPVHFCRAALLAVETSHG